MAHSDIFKFNMENSIAICNAFLIENLLFYQFKNLFILSQRYKIKSLSRNDSIPNPDPKFSKLNPDADFFKRNPDPESRNFKTQSQISIPNFEFSKLNPVSQI